MAVTSCSAWFKIFWTVSLEILGVVTRENPAPE
jgi:hypothetical protein